METLETSSLKIVRIDFTIVAPLEPDFEESPFGVEVPSYISAASTSVLEIDQGEVFFQQLYFDSFFVIRNLSTSELTFTLSNNLDPFDSTQIFFSLSSYHCDVVRKFAVKPGEALPIYIFFVPIRNDLVLSCDEPILMQIHLRIDCRLIRNHTKTILFSARCFLPTFSLDRINCDFSLEPGLLRPTLDSAAAPIASIATLPKQSITLRNLTDAPFQYAVRNYSQFFHVQNEVGIMDSNLTGVLAPHTVCVLTVHLNSANILSRARVLSIEKSTYNMLRFANVGFSKVF